MSLLNKFRKNSPKDLKETIFENICDILNTKKTFGASQPDFGLDSYTHMGSQQNIAQQIINEIKASLKKYENRIHIIDIKSIPNPDRFLLSFLIVCKIGIDSHSFQISFHNQKNSFNRGAEL